MPPPPRQPHPGVNGGSSAADTPTPPPPLPDAPPPMETPPTPAAAASRLDMLVGGGGSSMKSQPTSRLVDDQKLNLKSLCGYDNGTYPLPLLQQQRGVGQRHAHQTGLLHELFRSFRPCGKREGFKTGKRGKRPKRKLSCYTHNS